MVDKIQGTLTLSDLSEVGKVVQRLILVGRQTCLNVVGLQHYFSKRA